MFISASCFHTTAPLHTNKGGLPVKSLYLLAYKGKLFPIFPHNSLIYINYIHSRISVHPAFLTRTSKRQALLISSNRSWSIDTATSS